jgi:hypothetical protein
VRFPRRGGRASPLRRWADLHAQPGVREARIAQTPLVGWRLPGTSPGGILDLASDEASFVRGSELVIDGGVTAG